MTETVHERDRAALGGSSAGTPSETAVESAKRSLDDPTRRAESTAVFSAVCGADPDRVVESLSALVPRLADATAPVRRNATHAFGELTEAEPGRVGRHLTVLAPESDADGVSRADVAPAFRRVTGPEPARVAPHVDALIARSDDSNTTVRRNAVFACDTVARHRPQALNRTCRP